MSNDIDTTEHISDETLEGLSHDELNDIMARCKSAKVASRERTMARREELKAELAGLKLRAAGGGRPKAEASEEAPKKSKKKKRNRE